MEVKDAPKVESQPIVQLTESAALELLRLKQTQSITDDKYLRIGVKGGGCSGLSYILDYDNIQDNDYLYEMHSVQIIVDKSQAMYLFNMSLNYESGLNARGFTFENPNAKSTCGCGSSFGV